MAQATTTEHGTASSLDGLVATPDHDLGPLLPFGDPGSGALRPGHAAPRLRRVSATPYGAARVELRYEVPKGPA
jgi:hypothetical protein